MVQHLHLDRVGNKYIDCLRHISPKWKTWIKRLVSICRSGQAFSISCCYPFREVKPYQQERCDLLIAAELVAHCKEHLCKHPFPRASGVLVNMYRWAEADLKYRSPPYSHSSNHRQQWVFSSCYTLLFVAAEV